MTARPLRPHQVSAMASLKEALRSGFRHPMLQLPTGAGKTVVGAHIVVGALQKASRLTFCVPALSLIDQTFERFVENGIDPGDMGVIQGDHAWRRPAAPIQIASVQTLARREFPDCRIVVVDEAHVQHDVIQRWMIEHPEIIFIGLSATPWARGLAKRYDTLIKPISMRELIDAGYLSPFRVFAPSHPDLTGVKTVAGDYQEDQLADAMSDQGITADIVATWLEKGPGEKTLCFCVNRAHAQNVHDAFQDSKVRVAYIDANTPREERDAIGKALHAGEVQVVCNIGCLTTGIDWDVRCIILARPTKSEMLYCLDAETEILTSHGWKGIGEVKEGDCVASCDGDNTAAGRWSRVLAVIERDMTPEEKWVEYDAPRANFRVTDRHRMIFEGANESGGWRIGTALEMAKCKGGAKLPTAVYFNQPGVPLTADELYFIGMMMTDGTWSHTSGAISQSERHPKIIERIEQTLQGCGIGYSKRRIPPPPAGAAVSERFPRWCFNFSAGKPKAHASMGRAMCGNEFKGEYQAVEGTTGFRHLMPFLDKDLSPALMQISRTQLIELLKGIWDGDGSKKLNVGYDPKTLEICSARLPMLDRLQALCAIHGMTANLRCENGPSRPTPMYFLSITDKSWRSCGGYASTGKNGGTARNPRPQIEIKPATDERVWCVETEHGTIVTRRRGKVTVMGNCQIIGRGLRTADGKEYCLVLDHSDTTLKLGMVDEIDHAEMDDGTRKKVKGSDAEERDEIGLPKACPECGCLIPPRVRECPCCGHVSRRPCHVEERDGELVELGRRAKPGKPAERTVVQRLRDLPVEELFGEILGMQEMFGWSDGRTAHVYKDITGNWPNKVKNYAVPLEPSRLLRGFVRAKAIAYARSKEAQASRSAAE